MLLTVNIFFDYSKKSDTSYLQHIVLQTISLVTLHKESNLVYHNISTVVLGIETSCDETSAAVVRDGQLLSFPTC